MFTPKIVTTLRGYTREQALADVTAGVIVGIVALPLAIAFAIASGVTPERGLWTAIIAGGLISLLGGSRVQIGGPTGAFVVIVYGIVQQHGVDGLLIATAMAGLMLIALGVLRMGSAIKFVPQPLITGFTSGIAVIIFSGQVKDFLGLRMNAVPSEFIEKWRAYLTNIGTSDVQALSIASLAVLIILVWPRLNRRIPGPFVALVVTTAVVHGFALPVETIGSRFGSISASLPAPAIPSVSWTQLQSLFVPACTIAMLGAIESLLSAVVADAMIDGRHRSNAELVAQGVANVVAPLFGGIPATGAIARTATNVKNGGRTPVAGITHALTLLVITLFAAPWAALIPMATLSAVLVIVAYNMSEWRTFRAGLRAPASDVVVLLMTFLLTVLVDLTVAIGCGLLLSAVLFVHRMALAADVTEFADTHNSEGRWNGERIPPGVRVYSLNGPFFFGAAARFRDLLTAGTEQPRMLVLEMGAVPVVDATGIHVLRDIVKRNHSAGTRVLFAALRPQPYRALQKAASDVVRAEMFCDSVPQALEIARTSLTTPPLTSAQRDSVVSPLPAPPQQAFSQSARDDRK